MQQILPSLAAIVEPVDPAAGPRRRRWRGLGGYFTKTRGFFWVLPLSAVELTGMSENQSRERRPVATPADTIRCVLWTDPAAAEPDELVAGLTGRGVAVQIVADAPSVMVELAEAATDLLVIDQTQRPLDASRLAAAGARYFPAVICRKYITCPNSGRKQLVDFADEPVHDDDLHGREQGVGLVGDGHGQSHTAAADHAGQAPGPVVSRQEMAMLIGDAPVDATPDRDAAGEAPE